MSLLVSVTMNSKNEHVYVHLDETKGETVINLAVYARKSVEEWRKTNKPVLVAVDQISGFIGVLKKVRQRLRESEVCDE